MSILNLKDQFRLEPSFMRSRPNVLFIFSDQHAFDALGANGSEIAATPNLDRIAAEGVNFQNCYTPSPLCVPARMSLLTGKMPSETGCYTNTDILPSDQPTYAHAMGAEGYKTINVGRMHSMGPDQNRGFLERFIGDHSSNWIGGAGPNIGPLKNTGRPHRVSLDQSGAGYSSYEEHDHDVTRAALERLESLKTEQQNGDTRPFMLHVGYILPHQPYVARQDLIEKYLDIVELPKVDEAIAAHPYYSWWREHTGLKDVPATDQKRALAAYYALVEIMDGMIGSILDRLKDLGLDQDTLVVYASDHGEMMGQKGLWWKQSFFEGSAKVPLLMSWPGVIPAGEMRDQIVNLCDLSHTFANLAGAKLPGRQRQNLIPIATDNIPSEDLTFSEYLVDGLAQWPGRNQRFQKMVRSGPWKYIAFNDAPPLLFHLKNDPKEQRNLANESEYTEKCSEFAQLIAQSWDTEQISNNMTRRAEAKDILKKWAKVAKPDETHHWQASLKDNYLIKDFADCTET